MCLAIPIRVEALLPDGMARVTLSGVSKIVCIALLEGVEVGDYVLIHVGYALTRLDPEEAEHTLALMREAAVPGMEAYAP
jgi:hydrogenase expression/formation protein HypC